MQATGEPAPHAAGAAETFTVAGLVASTTYYFAIKTRDEASNWSTLSNVVVATTATPSFGANRIGIYASPTAIGTRIDPAVGVYFYIYFVLTSPTDAGGSPVAAMKGWEYTVTVDGPLEGLTRFVDTTPATYFNLGDTVDYANSTYFAALGTPVPVTNGMVLLHTWKMKMWDDSAPYYFYLSPFTIPTIAGKLCFLDGNNAEIAATSSSGDYAVPVFVIGGGTVATENETFGAVKALLR